MESNCNQSATCLFTLHIRLWTTLWLNWCVTQNLFFFFFSPLSVDHFHVYIIPSSCITRWYLRYNIQTLSKFVQFVEDRVQLRVRLLECSPASCQAPRNHFEEKGKKFITRRINNKSPSHFGFDTCRHSVEFWKASKSIFFFIWVNGK